jgi:hypothetical protein
MAQSNLNPQSNRNMLSIGVFCIIIVVAMLLYVTRLIAWTLIFPVILVLSGFFIVATAVVLSTRNQKYGRDAFSTGSLGLILIALGGAWYLLGFGILYSIILILLVLGVVAIAAALRRK